jgi:hypothetical protein
MHRRITRRRRRRRLRFTRACSDSVEPGEKPVKPWKSSNDILIIFSPYSHCPKSPGPPPMGKSRFPSMMLPGPSLGQDDKNKPTSRICSSRWWCHRTTRCPSRPLPWSYGRRPPAATGRTGRETWWDSWSLTPWGSRGCQDHFFDICWQLLTTFCHLLTTFDNFFTTFFTIFDNFLQLLTTFFYIFWQFLTKNELETSCDKIKRLRSICGSILIIDQTKSLKAVICCKHKRQFCHVMLCCIAIGNKKQTSACTKKGFCLRPKAFLLLFDNSFSIFLDKLDSKRPLVIFL